MVHVQHLAATSIGHDNSEERGIIRKPGYKSSSNNAQTQGKRVKGVRRARQRQALCTMFYEHGATERASSQVRELNAQPCSFVPRSNNAERLLYLAFVSLPLSFPSFLPRRPKERKRDKGEKQREPRAEEVESALSVCSFTLRATKLRNIFREKGTRFVSSVRQRDLPRKISPPSIAVWNWIECHVWISGWQQHRSWCWSKRSLKGPCNVITPV